MVSPIEMPIVLSQLPNIQKIQNAEQSGPEMAQAALTQEVIKRQERENKQVPKVIKHETDTEKQFKENESGRQEFYEQSSKKKIKKKENRQQSDGLVDIQV